MTSTEVTIVRIYVSESEPHLDALLKRLRSWEKVRGVTVFRGISGFGEHHALPNNKASNAIEDLPIVVEFFDSPEKVATILEHLHDEFEPHHVVWWQASVNRT